MKIIIDTHILLWWVSNDRQLPIKARRLIENPANKISVSVASIWEIAIKRALGRIEINLKELEEALKINNLETLAVKLDHAIEVSELPQHHSDPFDRMLVAQSLAESAHLLTHDKQLRKYGKAVLVV
jgi:PIN domain nuclease of toxin-antitoxin system